MKLQVIHACFLLSFMFARWLSSILEGAATVQQLSWSLSCPLHFSASALPGSNPQRVYRLEHHLRPSTEGWELVSLGTYLIVFFKPAAQLPVEVSEAEGRAPGAFQSGFLARAANETHTPYWRADLTDAPDEVSQHRSLSCGRARNSSCAGGDFKIPDTY